jgi:hypothetical protein
MFWFTPTRRSWFAAAGVLLCATAANAQVTFTPGANPASLRFPAGPDFATDVLGDPWDFANPEDLSPDPDEFGGWTQHAAARVIGTASAFLSGGAFRGQANNGDPQLSLLYRGGYSIINPRRTGIRYPIDTNRFAKVAIRVTYGNTVTTGHAQMFWARLPNGHPDDSTVFSAILGVPVPGTQTQVVDLTAAPNWVGQPVRGLRLDPLSQPGLHDVTIDWVRLTTPDGASAANMIVDVTCGIDWSVVAIDPGGETVMREGTHNGSNLAVNYAVNYGVLPPGNYQLGLRCGTGPLQPSAAFSVNAPATVRVTSPGPTTGEDYATVTLSNGAWDMAQDADIAAAGNVTEASFVSGPDGREFRARNLADDTDAGGDPQVYLLADANIATPIASSRYRYLTFTNTVEGPYDLGQGSVARVFWSSATSSSLTSDTTSQDIKMFPGRTSYTIDLARLSATPDPIEGTGIETECVACPTTPWASHSIRFFRIDPHEFKEARFFQLGRVHLTAMPEVAVGGTFPIMYRNLDDGFLDGDSHRVRFYADNDTIATTRGTLISGTEPITLTTALGPGAPDNLFTWNVPSTFAPGVYYIYAEITDVATGEVRDAYSDVPVRVFVPGASTVQINMVKPTGGGTVYSPFTITGCALNPGATGNSGVDDIQISATASDNVGIESQRGQTYTLGEAPTTNPELGTKVVDIPCPAGDRPLSSAADGAYTQSGFSVGGISGLGLGNWTLRVVARDAVDGHITQITVPFVIEWKSAPARNLRLVSASGNNVTIAWDPPNEGRPVLAYRIEVSASSTFDTLLASVIVGPTVTSGSGTLPNGVWHIRIVTMSEFSHDGAASNVLSLTLPGGGGPIAPGTPTLTPTQVSSNPITLTWAAGSGGTPTAYTLLAGTAAGASDLGVFPMGTATSVSAVAPVGMRIFVRVVASNGAGSATSNEIDFVVGAPTPPGTPTMNAPVVAGQTVTLSWSAPTSGGAPTSYTVEARLSPAGPVVAILSGIGATTLSVPNVPAGTYHVSVTAVNAAGPGAASNQVIVVVP